MAGAQVDVDAGQFVGRGIERQGPAEVLQGLAGPVLVFQGQAQEEVDVEALREGGVELRQGRQGLQGRGVQGRGLGQVKDDVGVAGAVQEMGAGDQHVHRREIQSRGGWCSPPGPPAPGGTGPPGRGRISSLRLGRERLGRLSRGFRGPGAMR